MKICCIGSVEEARIALDSGADALGLVSAMPSGPGVIDEREIEKIVAWVGDRADTVLLTSRQATHEIAEQVRRMRPSIVQLVDAITADDLKELRGMCPDVALMPVLHVPAGSALEEAAVIESSADAFLLDSGNPAAALKELGGTGRVHDWTISRALVENARIPVFLAGGLKASNVASAVRAVRPFGVDVCSGVRTEGRLDGKKVAALVDAARNA